MDATKISKLLPKRPEGAHKGTFGNLLVIAGSKNYPGAAVLSSLAAMRSGTGLVTLYSDEFVCAAASHHMPELTYLISEQDSLNWRLPNFDAILIGPGMGQYNDSMKVFSSVFGFLKNLKRPIKMVIDADGLNFLANQLTFPDLSNIEGVLTPHPGEAARLLKISTAEVQQNRKEAAKKLHELTGQTVVLKGANTIITNGEKLEIMPFSNPALATAGTGDVLAGIIGGFLAQGLNNWESALLGTYIHALSGEKLKEEFGSSGGLASDLIKFVPFIIKELRPA